jgi:hypothetical protein
MQEEVDQPVSYCDYGSDFLPRTTLIPHRPWLMPQLPIIIPPTKFAIRPVDTIPHSDTMDIPESDGNNDIYMPESDDISDHIDLLHSDDISNSNRSSQGDLPVSDDDGGNPMNVVQSDEIEIPMSVGSTDSGHDSALIVFPESPIATTQSIGGASVMDRDPGTGRFTAASFANFTDEL